MSDATLATVRGEAVTALPRDLYIPPDALEIFLDTFSGPLDLLLYLIKRQNFDILDIPIAEVTRQYMSYIELMLKLRLELAAEYLVMAAMLAEIKSRLLLPRPASVEAEESDPRAELVRRLQEYERIKKAAEALDKLPQQGRDLFFASAQLPPMPSETARPPLDLQQLALALQEVLRRTTLTASHHVKREQLSIRERMAQILDKVKGDELFDFVTLFSLQEGRAGVVVTFIAILELLKQTLIEMFQSAPFGAIQIKAVSH
jgi:segregation and condensation protein A